MSNYNGSGLNFDPKTGIHYGVIPAKDLESWYDLCEPVYPDTDNFCPTCEALVSGHDLEMANELQEPINFVYEDDSYVCSQEADSYASGDDVFVVKSPYFTFAPFCSPCAPGAVYLRDAFDLGANDNDLRPRGYCFGHEWFEGNVAPYPVYEVATGALVPAPVKE